MITIRAKTLARAISHAAKYVDKGAEVRRCTKPRGKNTQWLVVLAWPSEATHQTHSQTATPAEVSA